MVVQNTTSNNRHLTCIRCGETVLFAIPGITKHTRYTCPRCCDRISVERGGVQYESPLFASKEEFEIREVARRNALYGGGGAEADDLS